MSYYMVFPEEKQGGFSFVQRPCKRRPARPNKTCDNLCDIFWKLKKTKIPKALKALGIWHGAGNVTRTHDLLITNQLLYRLSYASTFFGFVSSRFLRPLD
jgi:hypothetical protein